MLYFEATYRIRMARSGAICERVTGQRLIGGGGPTQVRIGDTRIVQVRENFYLIRNETEAHSIRFHQARWYGGRLDDVAIEPRASLDAPPG